MQRAWYWPGFGWVTHADNQGQWFDIVVGPLGTRILSATYHAIAALAHDGLNLIVDEVLLFPDMLRHYLEVLDGFDVLFVGVRCPLATLETRERLRGDRAVGQARGHHARVHAHQLYDVEVDTAVLSPMDCAGAIVGRLQLGPPYRAFADLRSTLALAQ
jgi:chloramphenicol 3-O phosphotransferase